MQQTLSAGAVGLLLAGGVALSLLASGFFTPAASAPQQTVRTPDPVIRTVVLDSGARLDLVLDDTLDAPVAAGEPVRDDVGETVTFDWSAQTTTESYAWRQTRNGGDLLLHLVDTATATLPIANIGDEMCVRVWLVRDSRISANSIELCSTSTLGAVNDPQVLQVGECILFDVAGFLINVPCQIPHDYEVYAVNDQPAGDFPGVDSLISIASDFCGPSFGGFVGTDPDSSSLEYLFWYATSDDWDQGHRHIACIVGDPAGQVTDSLQGSGR